MLLAGIEGLLGIHRVPEGHVGVYWRGGALLDRVTDPGFHHMWPLLTWHEAVPAPLPHHRRAATITPLPHYSATPLPMLHPYQTQPFTHSPGATSSLSPTLSLPPVRRCRTAAAPLPYRRPRRCRSLSRRTR